MYSVCKRPVERLGEFKLLSLHVDDDLSWKICTKAAGWEAQQGFHFLWILRKSQLTEELLLLFCYHLHYLLVFDEAQENKKSVHHSFFFKFYLTNKRKKKKM